MNKLILSLILTAALLGCLFLAHWMDGRPAQNNETANQVVSTFPSAEFPTETEEPTEEAAATLPQEMPTEETADIQTEAADSEGVQSAASEAAPVSSGTPAAEPRADAENAITLANIEIPPMQWKGIPRLCQQDARWSQQRYSGNTLAGSGCGPVSLSRALTYSAGTEVMPVDLIDMKDPYGRVYRYVSRVGTDSSLFPDWAAQFDVEVRVVQNCNLARYEMEKRNAVAICQLSGGAVSQSGHYVLLLVMKDDTCLIMDPTLEGIQKHPDGIVSNAAVTVHCNRYNLLYPKGTDVPEEDDLKKMAKGLSFRSADYAEAMKKLDAR